MPSKGDDRRTQPTKSTANLHKTNLGSGWVAFPDRDDPCQG